jgi:hemerythrin
MARINKVEVATGVYWIEIPDADLRILCSCPADSVKHLMLRKLIRPAEVAGLASETGPNAILLSDAMLQNGALCNLAEFPILQMLYRQGMLIPGHPNNTGRNPLLIGGRDQVQSQLQYIYRGNYGLISEEELIATGVPRQQARDMMRLKLKFAFGAIQDPADFLDSLVVPESGRPVEVRGGVMLRRLGHNRFEFAFADERVEVDLNLAHEQFYECPYTLGYHQFRREYFAVVHSGEGDGWDQHRPAMGSVLVYQGRIFLIDAGPNLLYVLTALGIGVNEVDGIFHTHSHDDHFAGLTTLLQTDHRIRYFATPYVRAAVTKKLAALLRVDESDFTNYFDVVDLKPDEWNDIEGLGVRPVLSPHPVETTVLFFRALAAGGWHTYAHFADIVALQTLETMVSDDPAEPGISRAWRDRVHQQYAEPVNLKKVDIGGGMIHGDAADFRDDKSGKVILAHTALKLTREQMRIGSGASFGTVDVLVPTYRDFLLRNAYNFLRAYFPSVTREHINVLLNGVICSFNPETILIKEGQKLDFIYMLLTGQVEWFDSDSERRKKYSAGVLLAEVPGLHRIPAMGTYRATNFVQVLPIACDLYTAFVKEHQLLDEIVSLHDKRDFLRQTLLCGGIMSNRTLNSIAKDMEQASFAANEPIELDSDVVAILQSGRISRVLDEVQIEILTPGEFFGERQAIFGLPASSRFVPLEPVEIVLIKGALLQEIPNVRWALLEAFQRRARVESFVNRSLALARAKQNQLARNAS